MTKKTLSSLLFVLCSLLLTACDKDAMKAFVLEGTWTGYLETYYQDRWGISGQTFRTAMCFVQESAYSGMGYEVDYNLHSPYHDYYYCDFWWHIHDGVIYIDYADSWNTVRIYDYKLNLSTFRGYMDDGTGREIYFELLPDSQFEWHRYQTWRSKGDAGAGYHASGVFEKSEE